MSRKYINFDLLPKYVYDGNVCLVIPGMALFVQKRVFTQKRIKKRVSTTTSYAILSVIAVAVAMNARLNSATVSLKTIFLYTSVFISCSNKF